MRPRVVFDTNIMISGLLWRGPPYRCLQLGRSGAVEACYCQAMIEELSEKLTGKFGFSPDHARAVVDDWRSKTTEIRVRGDLRIVAADPDDGVFLECAAMAGAPHVVSGDRHLLDLRTHGTIEIVNAVEFLARVPTLTEGDDRGSS